MNLCLRALLWIVVVSGANTLWADEVELFVLDDTNWEQAIPAGKEVDAILGDVVLRNRYVTAVIAQPLASRNANMTVREVAGCLIDYTTRDFSSDQLSAYYPGARKFPYREWIFVDVTNDEIIADDTTQAISAEIAVKVTAAASPTRPAMTVVYRLGADSKYLEVEQIAANPGSEPVAFEFRDQIRLDTGKEDAFKTANGTHDLYVIDDRYWRQAYGVVAEEHQIASRSDARTSTLVYAPAAEEHKPVSQLAAGQSTRLKLHFLAASDLPDIAAMIAQEKETVTGTVATTVATGGRPLPQARLELSRDGEYFGTLWTDGSARIDQTMPVGNYVGKLSYLGQTIADGLQLRIQAGINQLQLETEMSVGLLKIAVLDSQGAPVPCKVQLTAADQADAIDFGPETATFAVRNVRYLVNGTDELLLPTGTYEAIVSRGPEYDAVFQTVEVTADDTAELLAKLPRVMDTAGWVSTEYHSHSTPSGDNTSHQLGRVLNLVCEHLEYAPCTEHNRIDTYAPHIESLGIGDFISSCTGMELTGSPLPLNHQNVFPLVRKPRTQDGGGPVTDTSPETQIQRVALWDDRSEKLVQQNHPDIGWLFYDKNGDQIPDGGFSASFPHIHAMEIHPLPAILKYDSTQVNSKPVAKNRMFNWLQLLNQGYRITGVVNTDAHYNFHGSGGYRNWVRSSTDEAGKISTPEMVRASKQGQLVMSNGPFMTVELADTADDTKTYGPGDDVPLAGESVDVTVTVQCPNWFDIDRVYLLLNGKTPQELNFRRSTHPDMFTQDVTQFEKTLTVAIEDDTHLIVVAAGENSQLGPVMGPSVGRQQPIAVSNPIFINRDGDDFVPNKDTLDGALPVKGD